MQHGLYVCIVQSITSDHILQLGKHCTTFIHTFY